MFGERERKNAVFPSPCSSPFRLLPFGWWIKVMPTSFDLFFTLSLSLSLWIPSLPHFPFASFDNRRCLFDEGLQNNWETFFYKPNHRVSSNQVHLLRSISHLFICIRFRSLSKGLYFLKELSALSLSLHLPVMISFAPSSRFQITFLIDSLNDESSGDGIGARIEQTNALIALVSFSFTFCLDEAHSSAMCNFLFFSFFFISTVLSCYCRFIHKFTDFTH